jgi:hypothetical protein
MVVDHHAFFHLDETCCIHLAKAVSKSPRKPCAVGSTNFPSASKTCPARATNTSGLPNGKAPTWVSTWRKCNWALSVPKLPVLAPIIATGLPTRGGCGERDAQSMAFLRAPLIELLYSGVAINNPFACNRRVRKSTTTSGNGFS